MKILVHICCGPCAIMPLLRLKEAGHTLAGFFFNPNIHPLAEYLRRREGAAQVAERLGIPLILADTLPEDEQRWNAPRTAPQAENAPAPGNVSGSDLQLADFAPRTGDAGLFAEKAHSSDTRSGQQIPYNAAIEQKTPLETLPPAVNPVPWLRAMAGRETGRCSVCWEIRLRKTAQIALAGGFQAFTSSLLYSRRQRHETIKALGETAAVATAATAKTGVAFLYEDFRPFWQEGITLSKEWGIYRQQYCGCVYSEYERYSRDFARAAHGA